MPAKIEGRIKCPNLFLTAKSSEIDIMQGFEVGGDDYLVKPFFQYGAYIACQGIIKA